MSDSIITLTKLEAGSRQLRTALTLWFDEGDPVSTYTLAFAAYEIFHAVSLHRDPNRQDLLFDSDWIKDEFRRDWNKHIRREVNFFKHADRDPEGSIEFNPELTEFLFLFASFARELCDYPVTEEEHLFAWWLQLHRPELLTDQGRKFVGDHVPIDALNGIRTLTRGEFREAVQRGRLKRKRPTIQIV
jgi:hypothetical protein